MSNRIFEEAPEQKTAAVGAGGAKAQLEKQARQLAYDTKYKVKQSLGKQTNLNPAQVSKAYLTQLAKSTASPAVKALAKKKLVGEEHLADVESLVEKTINNVLNKVFVEGIEEEVDSVDEYLNQLNEMEDKKYKIVVTDKSTGNKYRRLATRAKIAELRANPNIASVEMTEYGQVSKSEKEKGSETAAAKAGKDYDGDGKVESGAKEYRGAVHNAIQRKKGLKPDGKDTSSVKEEFLGEVKKKEDEEPKVEGLKKGKKNKVKLFPEVSEQASVPMYGSDSKTSAEDPKKKQEKQALDRVRQQEVQILQRKLQTLKSAPKGTDPSIMASYEPEGESLEEKITAKTDMGAAIKDFYASKSPQLAGRTKEQRRQAAIAAVLTARRGGKKLGEECGCEDQKSSKVKKSEVEDSRGMATKVNMVRNKFRAMGLKMSYEPEGEVLGEEDPCWKGYTQVGMKKKNGKEVPNCVPSKGVPKAKGYKNEENEVDGEVLDERTKAQKVAQTPRPQTDRAYQLVKQSIRRAEGTPLGQQKKEPGKKPPVAGEYGGPKSPAQKVAMRRAAAQRSQDMMHSRFD